MTQLPPEGVDELSTWVRAAQQGEQVERIGCGVYCDDVVQLP